MFLCFKKLEILDNYPFNSLFFLLKPWRIVPITLNEYANTPQAINDTKITYIFSFIVVGAISPYPIVSIVITAQYRAFM